MVFVYVVVQNDEDDSIPNGGVYPTAYSTFESAKAAVLAVHKEELNRQMEMSDGFPLASEVDVSENPNGPTLLYVEKGINIYIHKLPIKTSGGKPSDKKKTRRNKRN